MVGTEATCALVLEARCRLIDSPQHRSLVLLGYEDCATSADQVPWVMDFEPIALETFDRRLLDNELEMGRKRRADLLPDGDGWLLVEFGAESAAEAAEKAERFLRHARQAGGPHLGEKLFEDHREIAQVWEIREGGVGHSKIPGKHPGWPSWEDAAVAPERIGDYLRDLERLCAKHGRRISCLFGHVGHGCVHSRIDFDFLTREGIRNYRAFMEDAGDLVAGYGGSLSGEHGDGHARAELLPKMFGEQLVQAFNEFKTIWDPDWKMNPGKIVDPYPLDTHLRLDPSYHTQAVDTAFRFPGDGGSFSAAVERCFGVGACRDHNATMCPSYQVTLEEKHSTRGRARMLFEMMRSDSIDGAWRNEDVKEALDLCLACKGCLHECPVRVDMATYKAEFLSHYYSGRVRPRQAYTLGLIPWEARLAARAPQLANLLTQRRPFDRLGKHLAGIASERRMPAFAPQTFKSWFRARAGANGLGHPRVVLWADTFNDHFHPQVAIATLEVLEAAGFHVVVPERPLCCGRPLYDYGMLTLARRLLHQVLDGLREEIRAGTPVIAVEPSCGAVFRNELTNMLPDDEDAKRLARQTYTLGEFLAQHAEHWEIPRIDRKALVHFHCHQRATSDTDCDRMVLDRLGLDYEVLDTGCCGMAGSFGYEAGERYEVSVKVGEQKLLPAVREASPHTLIVTDGFSCASQIEQLTDRGSLHLAQVIQMAMHEGPNGPATPFPETRHSEQPPGGVPSTGGQTAIAIGAVATVGGLVSLARQRRRRRPRLRLGGPTIRRLRL
jgi:Fe-S oxidoreductase